MKKAILSAALALVMLLSIFPATAFAVDLDENDKFYFGVTSNGTTVSMKVDSGYKAVVTLPADDATVDTANMKINIAMQNVESLGLGTGEKREYETTVTTGLTSTPVVLKDHLFNAYTFEDGTINATIDGKACTYTFSKEGNQITANTDTDAARAAWHALTSYITTDTQATGDSYILIAKDSYAKIGTEYLRFEDNADDLKLDNFSDMSTMNTTIRDHVKLETCTDQGNTITLYMGKGTTLAVGSSVATLNKGCTVTITPTGDNGKLSENLKTVLSSLRSAENATVMVQTMVKAFDEVVGVVDNAKSVNVNFVFDKDPTPPTPSRPSSGGSYSVVTKDMPLVRSGSRGEDVKTLQAQLNALGYDCGAVDGIFGAKTYNAVVKFQKDRGLAVDGIVGKNTWAALGVTGTTVVETQTASITSNMPLLCRGSIGEAVKTLQTRLNALGYDCGTVDGIFGIKTYNAVVKFQTARALAVDGIVGVNTWGALA